MGIHTILRVLEGRHGQPNRQQGTIIVEPNSRGGATVTLQERLQNAVVEYRHKIPIAFPESASQHELFLSTGLPMTADVTLHGINSCCLFAGHCGTGKRFTAVGPVSALPRPDAPSPSHIDPAAVRPASQVSKGDTTRAVLSPERGLIPRCLEQLFIDNRQALEQKSMEIRFSCFDVSGEKARDLLHVCHRCDTRPKLRAQPTRVRAHTATSETRSVSALAMSGANAATSSEARASTSSRCRQSSELSASAPEGPRTSREPSRVSVTAAGLGQRQSAAKSLPCPAQHVCVCCSNNPSLAAMVGATAADQMLNSMTEIQLTSPGHGCAVLAQCLERQEMHGASCGWPRKAAHTVYRIKLTTRTAPPESAFQQTKKASVRGQSPTRRTVQEGYGGDRPVSASPFKDQSKGAPLASVRDPDSKGDKVLVRYASFVELSGSTFESTEADLMPDGDALSDIPELLSRHLQHSESTAPSRILPFSILGVLQQGLQSASRAFVIVTLNPKQQTFSGMKQCLAWLDRCQGAGQTPEVSVRPRSFPSFSGSVSPAPSPRSARLSRHSTAEPAKRASSRAGTLPISPRTGPSAEANKIQNKGTPVVPSLPLHKLSNPQRAPPRPPPSTERETSTLSSSKRAEVLMCKTTTSQRAAEQTGRSRERVSSHREDTGNSSRSNAVRQTHRSPVVEVSPTRAESTVDPSYRCEPRPRMPEEVNAQTEGTTDRVQTETELSRRSVEPGVDIPAPLSPTTPTSAVDSLNTGKRGAVLNGSRAGASETLVPRRAEDPAERLNAPEEHVWKLQRQPAYGMGSRENEICGHKREVCKSEIQREMTVTQLVDEVLAVLDLTNKEKETLRPFVTEAGTAVLSLPAGAHADYTNAHEWQSQVTKELLRQQEIQKEKVRQEYAFCSRMNRKSDRLDELLTNLRTEKDGLLIKLQREAAELRTIERRLTEEVQRVEKATEAELEAIEKEGAEQRAGITRACEAALQETDAALRQLPPPMSEKSVAALEQQEKAKLDHFLAKQERQLEQLHSSHQAQLAAVSAQFRQSKQQLVEEMRCTITEFERKRSVAENSLYAAKRGDNGLASNRPKARHRRSSLRNCGSAGS